MLKLRIHQKFRFWTNKNFMAFFLEYKINQKYRKISILKQILKKNSKKIISLYSKFLTFPLFWSWKRDIFQIVDDSPSLSYLQERTPGAFVENYSFFPFDIMIDNRKGRNIPVRYPKKHYRSTQSSNLQCFN